MLNRKIKRIIMTDFFEFLKTPRESVDEDFEMNEQSLNESFRSISETETILFSEPRHDKIISNPFLK